MTSVADIIHAHRDEIMAHWLVEARASASGRGLSTTALENVMPMFLSALADQVETGQLDADDRRRARVLAHLSSRLREGFDLSEIVAEFLMMSRCIARAWQRLPADERPSAADVGRLHVQVQVAMTEVTDAFYRHMLEDEQSEKRSMRRLQEIASQALHDVTRPLRERLGELLAVVMEAMGARCAALLQYEASDGELVLAACTGDQPFEEYATAADSRSFAGAVAAREEPLSLRDAETTRLEIPEALRHSGIHALLGVRLPARNSLLGVLYIGVAETREFTSRELRRLASLGERVALHVENARLFGELQDKIASLALETAMRERFVSLLAHDLRGPLSAARMSAQMLASEPASADTRGDLAEKIDRNIMRVDHMIRDLLDASRIRAGQPLPLNIERCDLGALAGQIADDARAMYGDRFVVVVEGAVRGFWSAEELHRALWNLVTNAVKYGAPDRPIEITVARHGDRASVSVHNVGAPIPAADQARIFDAYARAPTASAGGRIGWGLGLTLVRGVSEAHGGEVRVASDAASGTTFTIELPIDSRASGADVEHDPAATIH